jgi:hypothetical protein
MSTAFIDEYPGMHRGLASRIRARRQYDAAALYDHLLSLRNQGAAWEAIADAGGISTEDIWAIGNTYTQMPPATAVKLQSLTADDLKGYRWDATGCRLRLRSLVAMGHSPEGIARALGCDAGTVRAVLRGQETVSYSFRQSCIQLWECWWDKTPPVNNGAQRAAMTKARKTAEREGWCCPAALDEDELDYPGYICAARWLPATGSGIADDYPLG